jgi:hypothetical protein
MEVGWGLEGGELKGLKVVEDKPADVARIHVVGESV